MSTVIGQLLARKLVNWSACDVRCGARLVDGTFHVGDDWTLDDDGVLGYEHADHGVVFINPSSIVSVRPVGH